MTDETRTLSDDDVETTWRGGAAAAVADPQDADGTDGNDADGTDADGADGNDADGTDADGTDGNDADGTDA